MTDTHVAMQLVTLDEPLELREVADAPLGPRDLRIDVAAAGLNFGDLLIVKGTYQEKPDLPATIGMELAGTVREVGADVTGIAVGTRVASFCGTGAFASRAVVAADRCVEIPDAMNFADAAAFLVAYGTTHVALDYRARLRSGERLLVLGASGGIGLTAVELGKVMGAEVIACARGAAKLEVARAAGADHLIDSEREDIREVVKALGGADVVYDPIGGDQFKAALRACNPDARIIPLGFASGEVPQIPANIILVKNISVLGYYWGGYAKFAPHVLSDSFSALLGMYEAGKLRPHISAKLPLAEANEALALMRDRKSTGKVVLEM